MAPGAHHKNESFNRLTANVTFGSKWEFSPVKGPESTKYRPNHDLTKKKSRAAHIRPETSPYRRPKENTPGPGHHDSHLIPFAADITHKMEFGDKYKFTPKAGPPPGAYNIDRGHNLSKTSSKSYLIRAPTSPYRRP